MTYSIQDTRSRAFGPCTCSNQLGVSLLYQSDAHTLPGNAGHNAFARAVAMHAALNLFEVAVIIAGANYTIFRPFDPASTRAGR